MAITHQLLINYSSVSSVDPSVDDLSVSSDDLSVDDPLDLSFAGLVGHIRRYVVRSWVLSVSGWGDHQRMING